MADDGSREWPNAARQTACEAVTSSVSAACSPGPSSSCTALGYLLDQAADTTPAFTLVGIALGMVAGAVGFWLRVRSALRDPGSS